MRSQRHRLEETLIDHIAVDLGGDLISDSEAELLAIQRGVETRIEDGGSDPAARRCATTWNG